ncbi:MAG: hypothetical protein IT303_11090 [Dehalococcoidia bacterium]|nr:hypothetical protein [Dehalococcoidia bacterium]
MTSPEPIRFADILTTASAVANYLGAATITAAHLLDAIAILCGERRMEDLGRPVSPLLGGATRGAGPAVPPAVQELVQRWFAALGSDPNAGLAPEQLAALRQDLVDIS